MKSWIYGFAVFFFVFLFGFYLNSPKNHRTFQVADFASENPVPATQIPTDFSQALEKFRDFIKSDKFDKNNCADELENIYRDMSKMDPTYFNTDSVNQNRLTIMNGLFLARAELRKRLAEFQIPDIAGQPENTCVSAMRDMFRLSRFIQDYIAEYALKAGEIKPGVQPFQGGEPWMMLNPLVENNSQFCVKSGDIFNSRGESYTSAAIGRIPKVQSQFSHIAFVYVDDDSPVDHCYTLDEIMKNDKVVDLESLIQTGAFARPLRDYFADGNARFAHYRYHDPGVARLAAKKTFERIRDYHTQAYAHKFNIEKPTEIFVDPSNPDFNIPYNFKMDLNDDTKMFCAQVAYYGFRDQNVTIPMYMSRIPTAKENQLVDVFGITADRAFEPGDMEVDTRFDQLGEWQDLSVVKDLRQKDATLVAIYNWMSEDSYHFIFSDKVKLLTGIAIGLRKADFPKVTIGGKTIIDTTAELPKYIPKAPAELFQTLSPVGQRLQDALNKRDNREFPLTMTQSLQVLEQIRQADCQAWLAGQKTLFHDYFHPPEKKCPTN